MSADGDFWRQLKTQNQTEILRISDPANSRLTYNVDGQSKSWTEYKQYLMAAIKECNAQIADSEPFELEQRGCT